MPKHDEPTQRPIRVGYEGEEVTKPPTWHGLVTLDLLLNNLATGTFLAAAAAELAWPALLGPVARWAYPIAWACLMADLLCLVLDLGNPSRFHHMLRVFKPTSPMSLGTWALSAFSLPLTLIVAVDLAVGLGWLSISGGLGVARTVILALGLLPAFASALYKGVLFSTSSQPGWRDARWLGAYLVNSALTYGTGILHVLAFAANPGAVGPTRWAFALLVATNLVVLALLAAELLPTLSRARDRAGLLRLGAPVVAGLVVPLGLLLLSASGWASLLALGVFLAGGLYWRHAIVMLPHEARRVGP